MRKSIQRLQRRFPQLVVQLVMHRFPEEHPFSMHAFWLFNAGAFAGEGKRGQDNHALLILIDPFRQEAAIVPGYGLEPLLQREALDHLLEMSGPAFQDAKWQVGLEVLLEGLEQLLESVSVADEGVGIRGIRLLIRRRPAGNRLPVPAARRRSSRAFA